MKCNNKQYTINVTYGNEFDLVLRLKSRTFESSKPIDEDIDATKLENLVVKIGNEVWTDVRTDESGVICHIPADLPIGIYNVYLTATYNGVAIRAAYFECLNIPNWSYKSDAENYLPGSPIVSDAAYIIGGPLTDEEVEELKAELRLKIAAAEEAQEEAEQAKEDFDEKAEALDNLDNVAQQGTNPDATLSSTQTAAQGAAINSQIARGYIGTPQSGQADTLFKAIANINIDTSTLAQRTDVKDGNDTAISVSKEVRSEVGTGSDTAAETGTLFAVVKWVKDKVKSIFQLIGSPASGQPSTLFAAIAAGGGGGGDAQESTSQAILSAVNSIVNAHIINNINLGGVIYAEDVHPDATMLSMASYRRKILRIEDNVTTNIDSTYFPENFLLCEYIRMNNVQNMPSLYQFSASATNYAEAYFPNAIRASSSGSAATKLKVLDIRNVYAMVSGGSIDFGNTLNLIDIYFGAGLSNSTGTCNILNRWSPTNALSSSSTSLVDEGETFTSNLEKLLYNIREHIAANLPTLTSETSRTITFHANVKAAINADTATANAFAAKYWTIA